jgi:hypothetical protein
MAERLCRPLEKWEHVFHIDGDVTNNSSENLVIISKGRSNARRTI